MLRALHKSGIPIWHTEGFNPHPFATFPLPLSLGFRGVNECMDVKLEDDDYSLSEIISRLNECLPRGLRVFDATEAIMKAGKIAYASFTINIDDENVSSHTICEQVKELLTLDSIEIEKKTKKGFMKTVDIKPAIKAFSIKETLSSAVVEVTLSAGSTDNVNPNLLISALNKRFGTDYYAEITRNELYNADMDVFR